MGILKIVKKKNYKISNDDSDEINNIDWREGAFAGSSRHRSVFWGVLLISLFGVSVIGVASYWYTVINQEDKLPAYAYVGLKALTIKGKVISGAKIYRNGKEIGMTDSYGDWRRFIKLGEDRTIALRMEKQTERGLISAHKKFNLGNFNDSTIEPKLFAKVVLKEHSSPIISRVGKLMKIPASRQKKFAEQMDSDSDYYRSIWFKVLDFKYKDLFDQKKSNQLKKYVIPRLIETAQKSGLKVAPNAVWQVSIAHISTKKRYPSIAGLIKVVSRSSGGDRKIDFLRNYTGNAKKTSTLIMHGLISHTPYKYLAKKQRSFWRVVQPKSSQFWRLNARDSLIDPAGNLQRIYSSRQSFIYTKNLQGCDELSCELTKPAIPEHPPRKTWKRMDMQILGPIQAKDSVYVSGISAIHIRGKKFKYWGAASAKMFLSVIRGSSLIHRQKIRPLKQLVVSIPNRDIVVR